MNINQYDVVIVGSGFAGTTIANLLANKNKRILVIEKRSYIGGNMYDYINKDGTLIHQYGPHIFHTNYKEVYDYLSSFIPFYKYEHKVLGNLDGTLVPVPFNFASIDKCFDKEKASLLKDKLLKEYPNKQKISIFDLLNNKNKDIQELGSFIYEKVFAYYTSKQWGIDPKDIDKSVINRVPIILGNRDTYFDDKYQYMPEGGFTNLFNKMLDHQNIDIMLNTNAEEILSFDDRDIYINKELFKGILVYTGPIDSLFNYKYGSLPYRSLDLVFEDYDIDSYQPASVVNYLTSEKYTRITEFKHLTNTGTNGKTTILKEYSLNFDVNNQKLERYYPIQNDKNHELYEKYAQLVSKYKNLYLCGRLAEYKYYNMDVVIKRAMEIADLITINQN